MLVPAARFHWSFSTLTFIQSYWLKDKSNIGLLELYVNATFQIARQKSGRVYVCACTCVCLMGTLICFKKCSKYLTIAFTDKRDFTSFYKITL